jgi:hypothetical protein
VHWSQISHETEENHHHWSLQLLKVYRNPVILNGWVFKSDKLFSEDVHDGSWLGLPTTAKTDENAEKV